MEVYPCRNAQLYCGNEVRRVQGGVDKRNLKDERKESSVLFVNLTCFKKKEQLDTSSQIEWTHVRWVFTS